MLFCLLLGFRLLAPAAGPSRETETFRLYKFQQAIGLERSVRARGPDGTEEIRTSFSFTDRNTTVPLSATMSLARDGSAVRFQVWGSTSRYTQIDDRVSVEGGTVTVERSGSVKTVKAPPVFFLADAYAPVVATEQLWRYWAAHGRPAELTVFPAGKVSFERRGRDEVTDDAGKKVTLERYALSGLEWGRETVWFDAQGRLAALKAVDAEFDHFEATRSGYSLVIGALVASAAADGTAALAE